MTTVSAPLTREHFERLEEERLALFASKSGRARRRRGPVDAAEGDVRTAYVRDRKVPEIKEDNPKLLEKSGAFVTIKRRGDLRGCIGNFVSQKPLFRTIMDMAAIRRFIGNRGPNRISGDLGRGHDPT